MQGPHGPCTTVITINAKSLVLLVQHGREWYRIEWHVAMEHSGYMIMDCIMGVQHVYISVLSTLGSIIYSIN